MKKRANLPPCDEGPVLLSISQVTENSLLARFHGQQVFRMDFQILQASVILRSGSITPTSSLLPLTFNCLPPGEYVLRLVATSCEGTSQMRFVLPEAREDTRLTPPARPLTGRDTYELFMNLTGHGYEPAVAHGLHPDWVERIEAFRYDWGYGITGIRLCMRWYEWEPTPGQYTRAGLQKVMAYCRERGLKLSVFFWP